MRYLTLFILLLFPISLNLNGQDNEEKNINPEELSLRIKSISFVKNNEYFNPVSSSKFRLPSSWPLFVDKSKWIEGYTLIGFFFQPELVYSPSSRIIIRAGIHLLKYSGADKFSQTRPVFSTTLLFSERTSLTLGSLSGADSHGLFDPHFNSERLYSAYVEDGFRFLSTNDHIFNDTWLSWENYIFKGTSEREVFTFGESFRYSSMPFAGFLSFELPFQFQFKHFGGQITNYPEHVETFFNLATGLRVNFDLSDKRFGQAGIEYLYFRNSVIPDRPYTILSDGNASWFGFNYSFKPITFRSAYWKGHDFYAPNGNPIYASIMDFYSDYIVHERRVLSNSLFLEIFPESYLELLLGVETYYDLCQKRMDHSITLHLNFDKLLKLAALNRK